MRNIQKKYVLIIDYNLTRYDDVKMMADYLFTQHRLQTILIRPNPSKIDLTITPHIIDADPRSAHFIEESMRKLKPYRNEIHAGLVFSDNAVYSGAILLEKLNLPTDSEKLAEAAFSKIKYRQMEGTNKDLWEAQDVFVPNYKVIYRMPELIAFSMANPGGFVLKPACEGNNRGVMILQKGDDFTAAFKAVEPYLGSGIICEQLISYPEEYSYDGVAHLSFITKKLSQHSKYPVEYGQIVSEHIGSQKARLISRAGNIANLIVGQHKGPFHNEIKIAPVENKAAIIEPNRRPAGMKIWNLAEKVYKTNFYKLWIDSVVTNELPDALPTPQGSAAIRMLGVPHDGMLQLPENPQQFIQTVIAQSNILSGLSNLEWFSFQFNKKSGDEVRLEPQDNSDFIAQVCLYAPDKSMHIENLLNELNQCWLKSIAPYITDSPYAAAVSLDAR